MWLAAPIWLIGLLPWAGVSLYLLWGRRKRLDVPFLELWRFPSEGQPVRRRLGAPPLAVALGIAAMGLAVVAAGRPMVHIGMAGRGAGEDQVTIIVDRGIRMSGKGKEGKPRFV